MDFLVIVGLIIWVFNAVKKSNKNGKTKNAGQGDWKSVAKQAFWDSDVEKSVKELFSADQTKDNVKKPVQVPMSAMSQSTASTPMTPSIGFEGSGSEGTSQSGSLSDYRPIGHRMDTISSNFAGDSMYQSTEGRDTCDPSLGHGRSVAAATDDVYDIHTDIAPVLDLTPNAIVQGVVMNEILNRHKTKWRRY
ncbi:MAG: hypothetical protein GX096_12640 [Clostridiales bacterium]|nr:hypothetical protein [Clostridiales bacterium]